MSYIAQVEEMTNHFSRSWIDIPFFFPVIKEADPVKGKKEHGSHFLIHLHERAFLILTDSNSCRVHVSREPF